MTENKHSWPPVTPLRLVADRGERVPPNNPAAEQALLGALFFDNGAFQRVAGFLRPEHFSGPSISPTQSTPESTRLLSG